MPASTDASGLCSRGAQEASAVVALREQKARSLITPPNGSSATPTLAEQNRI
jgi:hypothetical protein